MADVDLPGARTLSPRAQEILRRADAQLAAIGQGPPPRADHEDVLDVLQEAIDQVRDHLMAIRDMLDRIAGERQPQ